MRYTIKIFSIIIGFILSASFSFAEETKNWSDEAEFSFVATSGNTNIETLSLKNIFKYNFDKKNLVAWKLAGLKSETSSVLTAESYESDIRYEHLYSERTYSYLNAGWFTDEFAGLDKRVNYGLGGGYKVLTGPKNMLSIEGGVSSVKESNIDNTTKTYSEGRLFGKYTYEFSKTSKFTQSLEYLYDFDVSENYRYNSETAITAAINSVFSLKTSYLIKYDNLPLNATIKDKDTKLSIAIVANF